VGLEREEREERQGRQERQGSQENQENKKIDVKKYVLFYIKYTLV
jgi:hypothetical protein